MSQARIDRHHDKTLDDSAGTPENPAADRGQDEIPTGLPNSDRHATETAHQTEADV